MEVGLIDTQVNVLQNYTLKTDEKMYMSNSLGKSEEHMCVLSISTYPNEGQISKQGCDHFPSGHCQPAAAGRP